MAVAGMGASFAVLFEVNRYTLKAAFDPIYEPFYWIRFALGLIAGVLLAELVPADTSTIRLSRSGQTDSGAVRGLLSLGGVSSPRPPAQYH